MLAILVGCVAPAAQPTPTTAAGAQSRAAATLTATMPPLPTEDVDPGLTEAGELVSRRVDAPPVIDGQIDALWQAAEPLRMPLTWGMDGTEHALDLELRSLHTDETVYFLAQWSGAPPSGLENTVSNKLTVHWRIPEPAAQHLDCAVVCHTAYADGDGHFAYANAETIPQGGSGALPAAGDWDGTTWTLEWSRPLINSNPFDLQFASLDQAYTFLVKVFERVEGRPDPVSARHLLVFQP